jgi:hypothetical protein
MSSKKLKPLASLFQQWSQQPPSETSSYRILLQSTNDLATRLQAAESVENIALYERAGVFTPSQSAIRDGVGGYAWFEHLINLAVKYFSGTIVYIATKPQDSKISWKLQQHSNVTVMQIARHNPWGWDDDDVDQQQPSLSNLKAVYLSLQELISSNPNTILIWESLTPLLAVHGFDKIYNLLTRFENFQLWPIRTDTLTSQQHASLEDSAQALLYLKNGEMTMIRQGIREKGNLVRQILPFRLEENGKLVELDNASNTDESSSFSKANPKQQQTKEETTSKQIETSIGPSSSSRSNKMQLKLEDDEKVPANSSNTTSSNNDNRPRIYLQDDDPEFDDMDEEDPDDDLDI